VSSSNTEMMDHFDADVAEMDAGPTAESATQARVDEAARQARQNVIRELAALPPLEYERIRLKIATDLGIRVSILDAEVKKMRERGQGPTSASALIIPDAEPWPEPVDGAALLDELIATFNRFLVLPIRAAEAMALWTLHTYCLDAADVTPRLIFTSPEKRCGKTTAMRLLTRLVARALPASNITAAGVFRAIEALRPTLLIDEADTFLPENDELRGVLNSGHARDSAYVVRTVGDNHDPAKFSTWAPVAIALIGRPPTTIEDRSIAVPMRRKHPGEVAETFRRRHRASLETLARKAARWAHDNMGALTGCEPSIPEMLNDRAADNWEPLLAIADHIGGAAPARARDAALELSGNRDDDSDGMLLSDIREIFTNRQVERIKSIDLCAALAEKEARPWAEYRAGKPITPVQLAAKLKPYGISPTSIRFLGETPKGYRWSDFEDAFDRYLPAPRAATPQQPNGENEIRGARGRNTMADVAAPEAAENFTAPVNVALLRPEQGLSAGVQTETGPSGPETDPLRISSGVSPKACPFFKGPHLLGSGCLDCGVPLAQHYPDYS
jgi:Protein of unknown function (DUF3631)